MEPKAISFTITGGTDVGRKRQRNEDSMRWLLPEPGTPESRFGAVMLVCDGMGGVGKGDLASRTAVEFFFKTYYDEDNGELDTQARVQMALEAAHAEVRKAATSLGMVYIGTTAAGVVIRADGTALIFNLGDSRVYLLRGETMTLVSKDQSVNAAMLERGEITPEQASASRNMNITAFIGHPFELDTVYKQMAIEPGDVFVLCSDGLWDVVSEKVIQETVTKQPPDRAIKTLIDLTLRGGAPDNVTVIIGSTRTVKAQRRWLWPLLGLLAAILVAVGALIVLGGRGDDGSPTGVLPLPTTAVQTTDVAAAQTETHAASGIEVLPSDTPPPSATATRTDIPTRTATRTASPTDTATATETLEPTDRPTRRPSATATATPSATATATGTDTPTASPTRTASATRTPSATVSPTATSTPTASATATASATPTASPTAPPTSTDTPEPSSTPTETPPPSPTLPPTPTSTFSVEYWVLQGTPESALDLVTVVSYDVPNAPPVEIYEGAIQKRYDDITQANPLDAGSRYVLVYLAPNVLEGRRFWWLIEDVQPQFEVLIDAGIRVYSTADPDAPLRSPVPKGELVIVTGVSPDKNWYKIRSRRGEGWISAGLLESDAIRFLGDPGDVPTITPPPLAATPDGSETPGTPESEATAEPTAEPSPSG